MLTAATFVVAYIGFCYLSSSGSVITHCRTKYEYNVGFEALTAVVMKSYLLGHNAA
jgi:hypothetical protein